MSFKEIFHFNNIIHKIKLDNAEKDISSYREENTLVKEDREEESIPVNEWHQEYELIYSSYILER